MTHLGGFRLPFQALGFGFAEHGLDGGGPGVLSPPERWMEDPSDISDESDDEEVGGGVGGGVRPREADGRLGENPRSAASRDAAVGFSPSPVGDGPAPSGTVRRVRRRRRRSAAARTFFAPGGDAEAGGGPAAANRGPPRPPDGAGALAAGGGGRPHRPPRRNALSRSFSSADLKPDGREARARRRRRRKRKGGARRDAGAEGSGGEAPEGTRPSSRPARAASAGVAAAARIAAASSAATPPAQESVRVRPPASSASPTRTRSTRGRRRDHPAAGGFSGRRARAYHHHHHLPGERPPGGDPVRRRLGLGRFGFRFGFRRPLAPHVRGGARARHPAALPRRVLQRRGVFGVRARAAHALAPPLAAAPELVRPRRGVGPVHGHRGVRARDVARAPRRRAGRRALGIPVCVAGRSSQARRCRRGDGGAQSRCGRAVRVRDGGRRSRSCRRGAR